MMTYLLYALYAFLVLLGIGVLLGVAMVVSEKFLHVEEDDRIKDVEALLPGANCGACGKAGCAAMAEAIVSGEVTKLSQCKVGKPDKNYQPIIDYMRAHPDKDGTSHIPTI